MYWIKLVLHHLDKYAYMWTDDAVVIPIRSLSLLTSMIPSFRTMRLWTIDCRKAWNNVICS
jgi:hypothetical protein